MCHGAARGDRCAAARVEPRPHRLTWRTRGTACAVIASAILALAAPAGAMPTENTGHHRARSHVVPTPTVVKETVIRPRESTDAIVFVLIGVGAVAGMVGAGVLGAGLARRYAPS
jgi:hypothetical protein